MFRHAPVLPLIAAALALGLPAAAQAEKADRSKPLVVESDGKQAAQVDLGKRITTVSGNVVISQGTLQIKADRVEIREEAPGKFLAGARGTADKPAVFRQKRDRLDEVVEAEALRVDYDGSVDRVRFSGNAKMRILRAGVVSDEASAEAIVYDQATDTLTFEGGSASQGSNAGRARLVFVPRQAETAAPATAPKAPGGATGSGDPR